MPAPTLARLAARLATVEADNVAQAERLDAIDAQLARLVDALDPEGTDPAAWPMLALPPIMAEMVDAWADVARHQPEHRRRPALALDLFDEPHRSTYGARIEAAAAAALRIGPIPDGPHLARTEPERLAAIEARLDRLDRAGPPCAACGEPDAAHLIDPDHAEDWQPQHRYVPPDPDVPPTWPVAPLPSDYPEATDLATCGTCGRSWDDAVPTGMTPAPAGRCPFEPFHVDEPEPVDVGPTGADIETGRDLAGMAEADGAVSDGADVPYLITQALAAARAEGYAAGLAAAEARP